MSSVGAGPINPPAERDQGSGRHHDPSRQHFIDKVSDPKNQEISRVRAAAPADRRLIELTQFLPAKWLRQTAVEIARRWVR